MLQNQPEYWLNRAAGVCAEFPHHYGKAMPALRDLMAKQGPELEAGCPTLWGDAYKVDHLGSGVYMVNTESHGGLYIPDLAWNRLPRQVKDCMHMVRASQYPRNWAEEDCDLAVAMPFLLPRLELESVKKTFGQGTDRM